MKIYLWIPFCIFIIINSINSSRAEDCKGSVILDSLSFDKVINKFKASLVKFDVAYPYGDKHDEFCKVATSLKDTSDLLVANVGVKDFGMKDNSDLADKFNINKDDYPVVLLFKEGQSEPEKILSSESQDFTANNIKQIIKSKTDIYIVLPSCIETFDKLAHKFVKTTEKEERKEILKESVFEIEKLPKPQQSIAKVYIKYMEKIIDHGNDFPKKEMTRISGLLKRKLTDKKKESLSDRLNILQSFTFNDDSSYKNEL